MSQTVEPLEGRQHLDPLVLVVPGLRDHVSEHWQTLLAARLPNVRTVPPMGKSDLNCADRVHAIDQAMQALSQPVVIVAHSGGCIMVAHWAQNSRTTNMVRGALLATPPDFESPMPVGYPSLDALQSGGWLPVPRTKLPFRSLVALSSNDPLGAYHRVRDLALAWGSETVDLGAVGHLNPASGYGDWPLAEKLIQKLAANH